MDQRLHYIDWLRVLAFGVLILFHCAVPFIEDYTWEINNEETSKVITRIIWWIHQWRLPLLFFIAGVAVKFSLFKRSIFGFYKERFIRLFVPLSFAIFFITPIQVYFDWLQKGRISESFFKFYPRVYEIVPYPEGAFTWSHMWFVAYLFVFTILLLPLFILVKRLNKVGYFEFLNKVKMNPLGLILLSAPFVLIIRWLFIDWPEQGSLIDDWYVFISSITFYILGVLLSSVRGFWDACLKYRRVFLIVALLCATYLMLFYFWDWSELKPKSDNESLIIFSVCNGIHIWTMILSAIGYAMKYLNFRSEKLMYFNKAIYPLYIIHQAVIVGSGYYILQLELSILIKLLMITGITLIFSLLLYQYVIRKTKITRLLFGMRLTI